MTNIQSPKAKLRPVDVKLVKKLLVRFATRNEANRTKAMLDRTAMSKNLETLGEEPELHLAMIMRAIAAVAEAGGGPSFEAGVIFGVCLTLSSRTQAGRGLLEKILADVTEQQEAQNEDARESEVKQEKDNIQ